MVIVDTWHHDGFIEVASSYLSRVAPEKGLRGDIDDNGDLLLRRTDNTVIERRPLLPALTKPSWFDPATQGPRL